MSVELFELNIIRKKYRKGYLRVGIAYPSRYCVGMSSLSLHMIYFLLNSIDDVIVERIFMEGDEYRSLESGLELRKFDIIIFPIHYELDYVNMVRMLMKSGIPPLRKDRKGGNYPLVLTGGPCIIGNPKPISDFIDLAIIGEIEETLPKIIDKFREYGLDLEKYADITGVYVPEVNNEVVKVYVKNLDEAFYPIRQLITIKAPKGYGQIFERCFMMEIMRGCGRGCKFCMISYVMRPVRFRSFKKLKEIIKNGIQLNNLDKVMIIGPSVTDHPEFKKLMNFLINELKVNVSIPSLRGDAVDKEDLEMIIKGNQKVLTIAPESSERLRDILGKDFNNELIYDKCLEAKKLGIDHVKLYFMIGLPGEVENDVEEIMNIVKKLRNMNIRTIVSITPWIPKPHTPMQWFSMSSINDLERKLNYLKSELKLDVHVYDALHATYQALFSIGDSDVYKIILELAHSDLSRGSMRRLLRNYFELFKKYLYSKKDLNQELPWRNINVGISEKTLYKEYLEYLDSIK